MDQPRNLNEIQRPTDNSVQQMYGLPTPSSGNNNNERNSVLSYHVQQADYSNMQILQSTDGIRHECPSCRGTMASSSSSCDSYSYFRDIFPLHSGLRPMEYNYHNSDIRQTFHRTLCLTRPLLNISQSSLPKAAEANSGNLCSHYKYTALYPCRRIHGNILCTDGLYANPGLYLPCQRSSGRRACESDPEYVERSDRNASITAEFGSSSSGSDGSVGNCNLQCQCCHLHSDSTLVDSNGSTYGSSEIKGLSDVSSYDSSIYRNFTPDCDILQQSNYVSEENCHTFGNSTFYPVKDEEFCQGEVILDYDESDFHCLQCAGEAHCDESSTTDSSRENVSSENSHSFHCKFCKHYSCSMSSDISLSGLSNLSSKLSTDSLNSLTSHFILEGEGQKRNPDTEPCHSTMNNERSVDNVSHNEQESSCNCSIPPSSTVNRASECLGQVKQGGCASEKETSSSSASTGSKDLATSSLRNISCLKRWMHQEVQSKQNSSREENILKPQTFDQHFVSNNGRDVSQIETFGNTKEICKNCRSGENPAHSSMVVFTEPQGQ